MKNEFTYLTFAGEEVAVWIEKETTAEDSAYYHESLLFFMKKGALHFRTANETRSFPAPAYVFVPKNTLGYFHKTWSPDEKNAELYIILLKDELIEEAIRAIAPPKYDIIIRPISIHQLKENEALQTLFDNLPLYFTGEKEVNADNVHNGMVKVIRGCITSDPAMYPFFTELSSPIRVHLRAVIDHHFNLSYTVEELAKLTGLSLSTFYREFRKEFGQPPHQWLMQRRLKDAFELLKNSDKSVSAVCYETGFKDLGHFSRRFKKQFGVPPSKIKK